MLVEFSCFGHGVICLSESLLTFLSSTKPKPRIAWEVAGVKELLSNCCHFDATFSAVFYRTSALLSQLRVVQSWACSGARQARDLRARTFWARLARTQQVAERVKIICFKALRLVSG